MKDFFAPYEDVILTPLRRGNFTTARKRDQTMVKTVGYFQVILIACGNEQILAICLRQNCAVLRKMYSFATIFLHEMVCVIMVWVLVLFLLCFVF